MYMSGVVNEVNVWNKSIMLEIMRERERLKDEGWERSQVWYGYVSKILQDH